MESQVLVTEWTSGGVKYSVTTPKNEGEIVPAWWERHDQAVDEGLRRHPKD